MLDLSDDPVEPGFVDIHSHVLFDLDDGAETMEESLAMLDVARVGGTSDIVATPHVNGEFAFRPELIEARIAALQPQTVVRIHRGCDFHLQVDNIEDALDHPDRYTINRKGYLLVEFPDTTVFPGSDQILNDLIDAGMTPIITHPERNGQLQREIDRLESWVAAGCYVQVTACSVTGQFGQRVKAVTHELMRRKLVHFMASDAHDPKRRHPNLRAAYEQMCNEWGEARVRPLFVDNPAAVLIGEPLDVVAMHQAARRRRWFQFWR